MIALVVSWFSYIIKTCSVLFTQPGREFLRITGKKMTGNSISFRRG